MASPREDRAIALLVALLFLAMRVAIAYARDPFFDELFTVWMARRPFSAILPALLNDSGPPLYYFLARIPSVTAERALSIAFASIPMILLLRERRWTAATLLAMHPAAVIMAANARPYALCGAFLAIGLLLLQRQRIEGAAVALVAAAYTHFAGAFFLPTLLLAHVSWRKRIVVSALSAVAFLPGLWLALQQPRAATAWMSPPALDGILGVLAFIADDPGAPLWVAAAGCALTILAASRSWRLAPYVLIPLALCLAVSWFRPSFFASRFAALLAFPLVLWIADSLERWGRRRMVLLGALVVAGGVAIGANWIVHLQRPLGDYRQAALALRENVAPDEIVVATGYLYLETVHQLGEERVRAFPLEQAEHPGWRALARHDLDTSVVPRGPFVWIGEGASPELAALRRERSVRLLYRNERAWIARVE